MPRSGHLPGHFRETFREAIEAFCAWDDESPAPTVPFEVHYQPREISLAKACGLVWNCTDILPDTAFRDIVGACQYAGVPIPTIRTYAAAARALLSVLNRCERRTWR